jgi:hypothetical protein
MSIPRIYRAKTCSKKLSKSVRSFYRGHHCGLHSNNPTAQEAMDKFTVEKVRPILFFMTRTRLILAAQEIAHHIKRTVSLLNSVQDAQGLPDSRISSTSEKAQPGIVSSAGTLEVSSLTVGLRGLSNSKRMHTDSHLRDEALYLLLSRSRCDLAFQDSVKSQLRNTVFACLRTAELLDDNDERMKLKRFSTSFRGVSSTFTKCI